MAVYLIHCIKCRSYPPGQFRQQLAWYATAAAPNMYFRFFDKTTMQWDFRHSATSLRKMGLCKLNGQVSLGEKSEAEFEECYLITSSSSSSSSSLMSCKSSFLFSSQNLTCVLCQRLRIAEIDLVDAPPRENSCPPNKQKIHNVEGGWRDFGVGN